MIEMLYIMVGLTNILTFKGKKISWLPMSPEAIIKDELEKAKRDKTSSKSENQIIANDFVDQSKKEPSADKNEIKLKGSVLLAAKYEISSL